MRNMFRREEEKPVAPQIIESSHEFVDKINKEIVDIHCSLTSNINSLDEFRLIEEKLDELTNDFYLFNNAYPKMFETAIKEYKRFEIFYKCCAVFLLLDLLLPAGLLITILIELSNYYFLKITRSVISKLEKSYDEIKINCGVIKNNIDAKYSLLNKKIQEYATNSIIEGLNLNEDYTYYYAIQLIDSYLDGFDLNEEDIDLNILLAMKNILQEDLKSDSEDIMYLLNLVKENNKQKTMVRKKL